MRTPARRVLSLALGGLFVPVVAVAGRPDTGGALHDFEATDDLAYVDSPSGRVRVHYSAAGPNETNPTDADGDDVPDLPQEVARTADAVLDAFTAAGFRSPLNESAVGLGPLGGSDAFDFYLVDFGGGADGLFAPDGCRQGLCAGHMLIDNDFAEYNYGSVPAAIRVLASHEIFHAVQAAYADDWEVWISEGTAVWAEDLFQPGVRDFLDFADAYLADAERPVDRPPVGPVPAFAYGTALFFKYLTLRFGDALLPELLTAAATTPPLDALDALLGDRDSSLSAAFDAFTVENINTGARTNDGALYPFAARLQGLAAEARAETFTEDYRFYPLAATYFTVVHPGGPLYFGTAEDATGLSMSLHALTDRGVLADTIDTFAPVAGEVRAFGDLPAGRYWFRGAYPEQAANSRKILFCLGGAATLTGCGLSVDGPEPGDDAGPPDAAGGDDAQTADARAPADAFVADAPDGTGGLPGDAAPGAGGPAEDADGGGGGGGCAFASAAPGTWPGGAALFGAGLALLFSRRRRSRPARP